MFNSKCYRIWKIKFNQPWTQKVHVNAVNKILSFFIGWYLLILDVFTWKTRRQFLDSLTKLFPDLKERWFKKALTLQFSTFETIDSLELAKDYINTKLVSQVTTTDHGRPRASTVTSAHASTPALFRRLSVNTPYIPETTRERAKSTEADTDQLILSINQLKTFT